VKKTVTVPGWWGRVVVSRRERIDDAPGLRRIDAGVTKREPKNADGF
jgi:hypothetical protein